MPHCNAHQFYRPVLLLQSHFGRMGKSDIAAELPHRYLRTIHCTMDGYIELIWYEPNARDQGISTCSMSLYMATVVHLARRKWSPAGFVG